MIFLVELHLFGLHIHIIFRLGLKRYWLLNITRVNSSNQPVLSNAGKYLLTNETTETLTVLDFKQNRYSSNYEYQPGALVKSYVLHLVSMQASGQRETSWLEVLSNTMSRHMINLSETVWLQLQTILRLTNWTYLLDCKTFVQTMPIVWLFRDDLPWWYIPVTTSRYCVTRWRPSFLRSPR